MSGPALPSSLFDGGAESCAQFCNPVHVYSSLRSPGGLPSKEQQIADPYFPNDFSDCWFGPNNEPLGQDGWQDSDQTGTEAAILIGGEGCMDFGAHLQKNLRKHRFSLDQEDIEPLLEEDQVSAASLSAFPPFLTPARLLGRARLGLRGRAGPKNAHRAEARPGLPERAPRCRGRPAQARRATEASLCASGAPGAPATALWAAWSTGTARDAGRLPARRACPGRARQASGRLRAGPEAAEEGPAGVDERRGAQAARAAPAEASGRG